MCIGTPQSHTFIIHVCGKCTRTIIFSYLVRYDFESSRIVYLRLIQFTCISTGRPCAQLSSRSIPEWTKKRPSIQSHSTSTKNHNYLELQAKNKHQTRKQNPDTPSSHHPFDPASGHRPQPLGVHIRSVDRSATNIEETICVKSGNQQDLTGKGNEDTDSDKHCRSKRENCGCHAMLVLP